jgi:cysteine desulfurase
MEIYLDNAATTKCYKEVGDLVYKLMCEDYGNPSSLHLKGIEAERHIKNAKEEISKILKVEAKEIIFTSGGTESDNLAVIGGAKANRRKGNHIITTKIEHPGVLNAMKHLEEDGFEVTYLPVDEGGIVDLHALKTALSVETILVSIMHVNNEIGSISPLEKIGKIVKEYDSKILFHSDGVQGFGKCHIYPKRMGLDLYSASGHKIHGPMGVGFLYKKESAKILPISYGGGQQKGLRSGTENAPGIAGLGLASKLNYQNIEEKQKHLQKLKQHFIKEIAGIEETIVIGTETVPHITSVIFKGISSEVLLHALEEKNIYVSSGSACSTHGKKTSEIIQNLNLPGEYQGSVIRFSMSEFTTKKEVDYTLETLYNCIPMLRRFVRK